MFSKIILKLKRMYIKTIDRIIFYIGKKNNVFAKIGCDVDGDIVYYHGNQYYINLIENRFIRLNIDTLDLLNSNNTVNKNKRTYWRLPSHEN